MQDTDIAKKTLERTFPKVRELEDSTPEVRIHSEDELQTLCGFSQLCGMVVGLCRSTACPTTSHRFGHTTIGDKIGPIYKSNS